MRLSYIKNQDYICVTLPIVRVSWGPFRGHDDLVFKMQESLNTCDG